MPAETSSSGRSDCSTSRATAKITSISHSSSETSSSKTNCSTSNSKTSSGSPASPRHNENYFRSVRRELEEKQQQVQRRYRESLKQQMVEDKERRKLDHREVLGVGEPFEYSTLRSLS